ncbi:hypothetical protein B9Z55_023031 [Caenorhabditis nigoni]|uniref:Peptidase M10 metallopeptidase domain-containing protein n=1 Tax=Caenorhabditis nigoni TaxID=1611254 RepID=A0A2G5SNF9_9PELO|nr:hypothetical protein B9Z55_023031 [Caenorhabditis nigoni]
MSTVMGQVDKEPLRLVLIIANPSHTKSYEYSAKIERYVNFAGTKFAELFLSLRDDFEFRGFGVKVHCCTLSDFKKTNLSLRHDKPDIFLNFIIGGFTHFTSCNRDFMNYFFIPPRFMKYLPASLENEDEWTYKHREHLSELMSHIIHEMCHSLGAFHSADGIMKRHYVLLPEKDSRLKNIDFLKIIDKKTQTIICESMSIISTLKPQRNLRYVDGVISYYTDQSVAAVFFLKESKYMDEHYQEFTYLDAVKSRKYTAPDGWDGFVVVHFCGHISYYSKTDVMTTGHCTKIIQF